MTIKAPIYPAYGTGQPLSPGAASASSPIQPGSKQLILTNMGANPCYVRVGVGPQTASDKDYPVPAGAQIVITKMQEANQIAHLSPLGTSLHVMNAEGF